MADRDESRQGKVYNNDRLDKRNRAVADGFDQLVIDRRIVAYSRTPGCYWFVLRLSDTDWTLVGSLGSAEAFLLGAAIPSRRNS